MKTNFHDLPNQIDDGHYENHLYKIGIARILAQCNRWGGRITCPATEPPASRLQASATGAVPDCRRMKHLYRCSWLVKQKGASSSMNARRSWRLIVSFKWQRISFTYPIVERRLSSAVREARRRAASLASLARLASPPAITWTRMRCLDNWFPSQDRPPTSRTSAGSRRVAPHGRIKRG